MEGSLIHRDLLRWSNRQWFWIVTFLFAVQLGILFSMSRPLEIKSIYPADPKLEAAAATASKSSGEWLELEDPMLFASPNWHGVSALAWMKKRKVELPGAR